MPGKSDSGVVGIAWVGRYAGPLDMCLRIWALKHVEISCLYHRQE
jgi:hypothetical protein